MTKLVNAAGTVLSEGGLDKDTLAADVRDYLRRTPRQLPSKALYDPLGSSLFDAICHLPWYKVTRAEKGLIAAHRQEILKTAGWPELVVELGPGNGEKLELLLKVSQFPDEVHLVDVSALALVSAAHRLRDLGAFEVVTHADLYEEGLEKALATRPAGSRALVLFLGSNIGNFDPPGADRFLRTMREAMRAEDLLLVGTDLVKPETDLLLAYDDPLGVTAAFNKNLLLRLNRDLGSDFVLGRFDHRAVWNAAESRVEMHLVSRMRQRVNIPRAGLSFELAEGESIWTESSYKYDPEQFAAHLGEVGFAPVSRWLDGAQGFQLLLARAV